MTLIQEYLHCSTRSEFPKSIPSQISDLPRPSYTVINNLLRTIRSGQEIKSWVDAAITKCGSIYDLLDEIEKSLEASELSKGIQGLRSYYFLILFASFLNETQVQTIRDLNDYEAFVLARPVFKTIERELDNTNLDALIPINRPGELVGAAFPNEVEEFVARRSGRILSAFTLLKSDFFSGLQKMGLPERVAGVPNFR